MKSNSKIKQGQITIFIYILFSRLSKFYFLFLNVMKSFIISKRKLKKKYYYKLDRNYYIIKYLQFSIHLIELNVFQRQDKFFSKWILLFTKYKRPQSRQYLKKLLLQKPFVFPTIELTYLVNLMITFFISLKQIQGIRMTLQICKQHRK